MKKSRRNPSALNWITAFAVIFISLGCMGISLVPSKPLPKESELTLFEGVPTNVIAEDKYSLRGGHRRQVHFTVAGTRFWYSNLEKHRYAEVLDAVQSGRPVRAWLSPDKSLYKLSCGGQDVLDYATVVADRKGGQRGAFIGGFFYGIPFFILGVSLAVVYTFQRRAYRASQAQLSTGEPAVADSSMPQTCRCGACGRQVKLTDKILGRKVKCPGCGNVFVAEPEILDVLPVAQPQPKGNFAIWPMVLAAVALIALAIGAVGVVFKLLDSSNEPAVVEMKEDAKPSESLPVAKLPVHDERPKEAERKYPDPKEPQPKEPAADPPKAKEPIPEQPKPKEPMPAQPPPIKEPERPGPKPSPNPAPVPEKRRVPVPNAADLAKAEKEIRTLFKNEYSSKKTADLLALSKNLVDQAAETKDSAASQYVAFREARDLAAKAGDLTHAWKAVDEMAKVFEVNAPALKWAALEPVAARTTSPAGNQVLAAAVLPVAEEALALDDFDTADKLIKAADSAARKAKSIPLTRSLAALAKDLDALRKEYAKVKEAEDVLAENPKNPAANLMVGKYLCFFKGNWPKGLPLMALGSDDQLKALAAMDLAEPATGAGRVEIADGWFDLARGAEPAAKKTLQRRALFWYRQAVADLKGLAKTKAEKRIEDLEKATESTLPGAGWIAIFRSKDPSIWGKNINSKFGYAVPLKAVPDDMQFLRMTNLTTRDYVIIKITRDKLTLVTDDGTSGWNGDNLNRWGGYHLGIYKPDWRDETKGTINVRERYKGWGFGHPAWAKERQGWTWAGKEVPPTVFEIAVKAGKLSSSESKKLLSKADR